MTGARLPVVGRGRRSVRLDPGTVWIRADLMGAGFPAGSYVGINHTGGSIQLGQSATVTGSFLDVVSPFLPTLEVTPATDTPAPVPGACASAAASITLPAPLTLTATTSGWQVAGPGGTATAWGQTYAMTFPSVPGAVTFFPRLWAAVLPCEADRNDFDPAPSRTI